MKLSSLTPFLLALGPTTACGDPPKPVVEGGGAAAHDDHAGHAHAEPPAPATFSASGTIRLTNVESFGERACFFVFVRSVEGPLWLMQPVQLAGKEPVDGTYEAKFTIDQADNLMGNVALPRPSGDLNLHVTYNPGGYVEDEEKVAAAPIPVNDGDAEIVVELAAM